MTDIKSKELLLIYNEKSGRGSAQDIAELVGKLFDAQITNLHTFLDTTDSYLSLAPQLVVALGGDGTHFSVLNVLQQQDGSRSLLPLHFGGENVLSKSVGLRETTSVPKITTKIHQALRGDLHAIATKPNTVTLSEQKHINSNWMVNAGGIVIPILTEVEELRSLGAGSFMQRHAGLMKYLWKSKMNELVEVILEDGTTVLAYDATVVNDFLPRITSHYSFLKPAQIGKGENYVITVGEHKLGVSKSELFIGIMLDVCAHALFGLESVSKTVRYRSIASQTVQLSHSHKYCAIDSELYANETGRLTVGPALNSSMVKVFTGENKVAHRYN